MQRYIRNEKGDGKWERGEPGKVWKNINHKVKLEVMLAVLAGEGSVLRVWSSFVFPTFSWVSQGMGRPLPAWRGAALGSPSSCAAGLGEPGGSPTGSPWCKTSAALMCDGFASEWEQRSSLFASSAHRRKRGYKSWEFPCSRDPAPGSVAPAFGSSQPHPLPQQHCAASFPRGVLLSWARCPPLQCVVLPIMCLLLPLHERHLCVSPKPQVWAQWQHGNAPT